MSTRAPPWDLAKVLRFLQGVPFEPLRKATLRDLTGKTLFLLSLASAKRVGEIQAVSKSVSFQGTTVHLSYLPAFRAKTESERNPLPRSFPVVSLDEFAANLPAELTLCPVRALRIYLSRTKNLEGRPRSLFVSPKNSKRPISKNAVSYFIREVITEATAGVGRGTPSAARAHSVRSISTSAAFLKNYAVQSI